MHTSLAEAAAKVPAYCASGHISRTPAQILACVRAGWQEPTTGAASLGTGAGHNLAPFLIVAGLVLLVAWLAGKARSRSAATSS